MTSPEPMSLERLAEEMRPLAGQIILLYGTDLVRLHGVAEDYMDLYYITECRQRGVVWNSAVGGYVDLKSRLGPDYPAIENQFSLNGIPERPFQVVRAERLRRIWLEGEPEQRPDTRDRIQNAFEQGLDELDRTAAWEGRRRAQNLVDLTIEGLRAKGLDEPELQSFRRLVQGNHTEAHDEAEEGVYAYPLGALQRRREILEERALTDIRRQSRAIHTAGRLLGYDESILPAVPEGFNFDIHQERHGPELLSDLGHICDEILDGTAPAYNEETDDYILEVIARAVPMLSRLIGIWLEEEPELVAIWAGRGANLPVWWPAAAFCMANWKKFADNPGLIVMDEAQAEALRADLAHCRLPARRGGASR